MTVPRRKPAQLDTLTRVLTVYRILLEEVPTIDPAVLLEIALRIVLASTEE